MLWTLSCRRRRREENVGSHVASPRSFATEGVVVMMILMRLFLLKPPPQHDDNVLRVDWLNYYNDDDNDDSYAFVSSVVEVVVSFTIPVVGVVGAMAMKQQSSSSSIIAFIPSPPPPQRYTIPYTNGCENRFRHSHRSLWTNTFRSATTTTVYRQRPQQGHFHSTGMIARNVAPIQIQPFNDDDSILTPHHNTTTTTTTSSSSSMEDRNRNSSDDSRQWYDHQEEDDPFVQAMIQLQYTPEQRVRIRTQLQSVGLWDITNTNSTNQHHNDHHHALRPPPPSWTLRTLTQDYVSRHNDSGGTTISTMLMHDFQLPPLVAHQTRTALLHLHQQQQQQEQEQHEANQGLKQKVRHHVPNGTTHTSNGDPDAIQQQVPPNTTTTTTMMMMSSLEQRYKSTIVRPIAQRRWAMCQSTTPTLDTDRIQSTTTLHDNNNSTSSNKNMFAYSLQPMDEYPICQVELQEFYQFMTLPSVDSQEETPIRPTTANIYIRHAKLFLGWYWSIHLPATQQQSFSKELLSLYVIFPTKDKIHANSILQYILWLRTTRYIAVSYEANLLRGLCKLLKFRYRKESSDSSNNNNINNESGTADGLKSKNDDTTTTTSFNDIPVIRELRKLHRDANRRQAVAPRVSNEDHKWLSWPDYIQVVQRTKDDLLSHIQDYETSQKRLEIQKNPKQHQRMLDIQRRRVAVMYQKYLILSFFANVPDRQRTIRELEIGRSFVRDNVSQQWCIKHTPDDYKTGKTYGERPPLQLPTSLTIEIDDFIAQWRPALIQSNHPNIQYLFLGPRTGTPLTSDTVYLTVSKTCYSYTGKRTNPHLLRDMIVTHVRESSTVTEQQLEALALFMGHSAAIQRKSYDRRTLTKKVAPAIALMEQVNANSRSTPEL